MRRYRVPADLRRRFFDGLDARLKRSIRTCSALGALLLLVLLIVPARQQVLRTHRLMPRERSARVLPQETRHTATLTAPKPEPPKPEPPKPQPPEPKPPAPRPPPERTTQPPAERAALPPRGTPQGKPDGGGVSRPAGVPAPQAGSKGRAAGAKVANELRTTTQSVDQLLASLQGTVPVASGAGQGGGKGVAVGAMKSGLGGRGTEDLSGIDALLEGTGAGTGGGAARGVAKGGVDIVDDGVLRDGDGAGAWGRDSRSLMAVVERYKSGVKFCYDNALKKSPRLAGKITLQMDIAPSGEVGNLLVLHDGLGDEALQRCIRTQVASWRFPAIDAGTVRFTLPLVFEPPNG